MVETKEVMCIKECAEYLGISEETLYMYVNKKLIPAFKLGNRWRFKKSVLDNWMTERSTKHGKKISG